MIYGMYLSTTEIGKYYQLDWNAETKELIEIPYEKKTCERERQELDDTVHDYLLNFEHGFFSYTEEEIQAMRLAGYDLDPQHWARIKCPYLPFIHFLYLPEGWII